MEAKDYAELFLLVKGAEKALLSGQLSDWQHANTSTFHVLASMILDLNERLTTIGQVMDSATLASHKPPKPRIVVEE